MVESSEETGIREQRSVYTPPCIVRMTDLKEGAGECIPTGSGDSGECNTGHQAADCVINGNTAR